MGIALQIIEIASASIPQSETPIQVEKVNLKVGKMAAIVPDSLRFCFEIAAKDSLLSGAVLHIEEEWTIGEPVFQCPQCGSGQLDIISGRELNIESIEIADDET